MIYICSINELEGKQHEKVQPVKRRGHSWGLLECGGEWSVTEGRAPSKLSCFGPEALKPPVRRPHLSRPQPLSQLGSICGLRGHPGQARPGSLGPYLIVHVATMAEGTHAWEGGFPGWKPPAMTTMWQVPFCVAAFPCDGSGHATDKHLWVSAATAGSCGTAHLEAPPQRHEPRSSEEP
ncbi:uncharacterized protein LOC111549154 [Piliocolobus tephrosceles]|uniref:uncharacterized protein LOC111549154 n=1 Tax=Piliocolobus tephrosceles TaxID=591936 RepID=UPI000E6B1AB2|nr:uncharacterized protein LOC111549154 [Piliocolobus tephrosceles]